MTQRGALLWLIVGLLGIACAGAIGWSASLLGGQHIGLASEPLSVVRGLAPVDHDRPHATRAPGRGHLAGRATRPRAAVAGHSHGATGLASPARGPQTAPAAPVTSPVSPGGPMTAPPPITPVTPASAAGGSFGSRGQGGDSGGGGQRDDSSGGGGGGGSSGGPDD